MHLEVNHLRRTGLAPLTFSLYGGECMVVTGPSGAGKSMLLRALVDLDPNQGEVSLDGMAREQMPAPQWRRLLAYLPAEPGWWADTVGEHFRDWSKVVPLIQRLGLPPDAHAWPMARPSTGERLRLALVRALEGEPRVLLLDEPTAGLDAASVAVVEALIAERVQQGLAVLWVSHDPLQAARVGQRQLRGADGSFVEVQS